MKKSLIISPHSDDFAFSIGSFTPTLGDVTVASPFDGIPDDEKGKQKHLTLNREHQEACEFLGVKFISGHFLDDVYHDTRNLSGLVNWFQDILDREEFEQAEIYAPLGIRHYDHYLIRDIFIKHFRIDYFFEELPYGQRFTSERDQSIAALCRHRELITMPPSSVKETACRLYVSQTDEEVIRDLMVQERIWR